MTTAQAVNFQPIAIPVATSDTAQRYVDYAEALLDRAATSTDPVWTDTLQRMAGQMMEIAIYLGAKTH